MNLFRSLTLQARVSLWSTALVLAGVVLIAAAGIAMLRDDLRSAAVDAQRALVENTASDIDDKFALRREALVAASGKIDSDQLSSAQAMAAYLDGRPFLRSLFESVLVADDSGRIIADTPSNRKRVGMNVSDRQYFQRLLKTGAPVISDPVLAKTTGEPTIIFAAPILGPRGEVKGALLGSVVLTRENFLAQIRKTRVGQEGYFYLATKGPNPTLVLHPDAQRMMKPVPPADKSKPLHRALAGFEGTIEGRNSVGLDALYTFKGLTTVPWVLCAAYPSAEAYSAIDVRTRQAALGALLFAIIGGLLTAAVTRAQLRPLIFLEHELKAAAAGHDRPLNEVAGARDLRELAQAYNDLREHKLAAQAAQQAVQDRLSGVLQHAADGYVSVNSEGLITEWNRQAEETFGWPKAQVIGKRLNEVIVPEESRRAHNEGFARFVRSGAGSVVGQRVELLALHRTGRLVPIELSVSAVEEQGKWSANAFIRDISERREEAAKLAASERRLRDIMDNVPAEIAMLDASGHFVSVNRHRAATYGLPARAIEGTHWERFCNEEEYRVAAPWFGKALAGEAVHFESSSTRGGVHHYLHYFIPDRDATGMVCGVYDLTLDITDRKNAERQLAANQAQLRTITNNLPVLIAYISLDRHYTFCNATYEAWFKKPVTSIVGRPVDDLLTDDERTRHLSAALRGERVEFNTMLRLPGTRRHVRVLYIPDLGPAGDVLGVHALTFDVTAAKKYEEKLLQMARHDSLTGLPNRRHFEEKLDEAMARARRADKPMALLYLDLDKFKQVNDSRGHAVGDELLRAFATRLLDCVRTTDTVCRLAGDEFTIILEGLQKAEEAGLIADKIEKAMREPLALSDGPLCASASIGVAVFEGGKGTSHELVVAADAALYAVKRAGRGTFHIAALAS